MNTKTILGISFAAVFAITMMANTALADHSNANTSLNTIVKATDFSMLVDGKKVETATNGHDIVVYAFLTDAVGKKGNIAYVAAVHPSFNDDVEQAPGNKVIHAHYVELDKNLCVQDIKTTSKVNVAVSDDGTQKIHISGTNGERVVNWAIAGYDASASGICPEHVYDFK